MWIAVVIISIFSFCQGMIKDITFDLTENCPIGTVIGNIKISAELYLFKYVELNLENGDSFEDFHRQQKANTNLFRIDNKTSDLITVTDMDRESLCSPSLLKSKKNCSILQIVSVNKLMWINVNIIIIDVNDNYPQFRKANITLSLSETSKIHSTVQIEEATDLDSSKFGPLIYSLKQQYTMHDQFQLQKDPLKLVLLKPLDYETVRHYVMTLIACDSGIPALCENQTINIDVINENDESPIFLRSNYTAIINEDASVGQVVLQPKAYDRDSDEYGKVKYYISSGYDFAKTHFSIDPDNGNMMIKEKFRNPTKLKFSIEAKDKASNPLIGRTWIFLHIVDVNNNNPVVQINPIEATVLKKSTNYTLLEIMENNKAPLNLAFITVTDSDQGENARCTCQLLSQDDHLQLISVHEISERNIYRLVSNKIFDAEILTKISTKITCNDHGEPQNSVSNEIEVRIKDENEYSPSFDQSLYEIEVFENCTVGMVVKLVKAYDRDVHHSISFALTPPGSTYFEINNSGTISTKSLFDYETLKTMDFYIMAVDAGIKSHTSSARVSVFILDVNDNKPEIEKNSFHIEVSENLKGLYKVGTIKAFDKDSGLNAQLKFFLLNTSNEANENIGKLNLFSINQHTGDIHSKVTLDYENCTMYLLSVKVTDCGTPSLSTLETIYIHVKDANDNGPLWIYPNKNDHLLNISINNIRDSILTRVRAIDIDSDQYNTVHYYLLNHNDILSIDKSTGVLTLRTKITSYTEISILLQAVDAKSTDKYSSQSLFIQIQNDQETYPSISPFSLTFPVLISIIGISSLISIVLVITLFFFCCRKRRICRNCVSSHELVESKYHCNDMKSSSQHQKTVDIPLDLVTDNDVCNTSIVEDSVKLILGSMCSPLNSLYLEEKCDFGNYDTMTQEIFQQRNSTEAQQNYPDYYRFPSTTNSLHSPYISQTDRCMLQSSSDEETNRYIDHIDKSNPRTIQLIKAVDPSDCMINSYATFVKCGCGMTPAEVSTLTPSTTKSITAPFTFNGSAWIPTESMANENYIVQTQRDSTKTLPLKSIMKKTMSTFINIDSSSSSGQCNDTDQTSSVYDSGCFVGISDGRSQPFKLISSMDKTYQCKKSQV